MKTITRAIPESSLEAFAVAHDLTMEVVERGADMRTFVGSRYYANFVNVEVKEGNMLSSAFGNGNTPALAIAEYTRRISEKLLIVDAYKPQRREIQAPRFGSAE